jgi:serralysin
MAKSVSLHEAAATISRDNDPQGDGYGILADVSYSFWGGTTSVNSDAGFSQAQQSAALDAMRLWGDVAQIHFFVDNEDPEIAYQNYVDTASKADAHYAAPGHEDGVGTDRNPDTTGVVGFNLARTPGTELGQGQGDRQALIHEIGHALGLSHPGDYNAGKADDPSPDYAKDAAYVQDTQQYSIMSYFDPSKTWADHFSDQVGMSVRVWARTPLIHDIAAIQMLYGANMDTRTGDNFYGFHSNSGPEYALSKPTEVAVFAIYDAGGNDTLDLSDYNVTQRWDGSSWVPYEQRIDLNPGTFSNAGGLTYNISMADAVDVNGNNSWEQGFDPTRVANYIENAIGGQARDVIYGNATGNTLRGEGGNDEIWAGDGYDRVFGGAGTDNLHGGDKDDTLWGNGEDDTLNGDAGADTMYGGTGNDTYVVDNVGDNVNDEPGAAGGTEDKIYTTLSTYDMSVAGKGIDVEILQFTGTGRFAGRGNDLNNIIVGGGERDTLEGGRGNDLLNGAAGADRLIGGAGDDVYIVGAGDEVVENALEPAGNTGTAIGGVAANRWIGGGTDTVETALARYTLGANVENLTFTKANALNVGYGNSLDNVMRGSLYGNDAFNGLAGNDTYYVDNEGDVIDETIYVAPSRTSTRGTTLQDWGLVDDSSLLTRGGFVDAGSDNDTVVTTLSRYDLSNIGSNSTFARSLSAATLYGVVENLTYNGFTDFTGIGNDANNVLRGGAGNDSLLGGKGHDTVYAGAGQDGIQLGEGDDKAFIDNGTFQGGDVVVGGGGFDSVYADDTTSGLTLNMFRAGTGYTPDVNKVAFTSAAIDIDKVVGSIGADVIDASRLGAENALEVVGLAGDDTLTSGAGSDQFNGGIDQDTIVYLDARTLYQITALPNEGNSFQIIDTRTGVSDVVREVEFAQFGTGSAQVVVDLSKLGKPIIGTETADTLIGTLADEVIEGRGGGDSITGGGGRDTLLGGPGDDFISFDNFDTVNGGTGYDYANADTSTNDAGIVFKVAGTEFEVVQGNAGNDRIDATGVAYNVNLVGHGGQDALTGGDGDDAIYGVDGNDTIMGGPGFDQLHGGNGDDEIHGDGGPDNPPWTDWLFGGAGNDVLYGSGGGWVIGDEDNDTLYGKSGDLMMGGTGEDIIIGDAGFQQIIGGAGKDIITGGAGFDRFDYSSNWGWDQDRITDFEIGVDKIGMLGWTGLTSFEQLSIRDVGGGTEIAYDGNSILLDGITASQIKASDFLFG